eukprot:jgi/Chlat1/8773/Chrsp90S08126
MGRGAAWLQALAHDKHMKSLRRSLRSIRGSVKTAAAAPRRYLPSCFGRCSPTPHAGGSRSWSNGLSGSEESNGLDSERSVPAPAPRSLTKEEKKQLGKRRLVPAGDMTPNAAEIPVTSDANRYQFIQEIGKGNFGVTCLMLDKLTGENVAVKFIERGPRIDENVCREVLNHRKLRHPNIVQFKRVLLTPTHLGIVMEYCAGGELFHHICKAGRFSEDEARFFFQQLISGVEYCHTQKVVHRDLKLENALLDGNPPRLKICDFGYSKSEKENSQPHSMVGTPAYIAPEVLTGLKYDGKVADIWSSGVLLYVMLVGAYPFEDSAHPRDLHRTIKRIMSVQYSVPADVRLSPACYDILSRIFVADSLHRITVAEIKKHPWFLRNLPVDLLTTPPTSLEHLQSEEEVRRIITEAKQGTKPSVFEQIDEEDESDNDDGVDVNGNPFT